MEQMKKPSPMTELLQASMDKIKEMVDVNTVVGEPIVANGMTLVPVSRVSFGFGSGGGDMSAKVNTCFGSGAGVRIEPIGFLIIRDNTVRMLNILPPPSTTMDRFLEMLPDLVDKLEAMNDKRKGPTTVEVEVKAQTTE